MSCVTAMAPPAARDFEIHRLNRVEHVSTYRLADRFKISQTRVRQIVYRVGEWLARVLPERSDAERERETRLAQCLAADQLQSQIEKLQVFWDETRDPKFLRQQTRAILALARLGVLPGAIDAAAADAGEQAQEHRVGDAPTPTNARTELTGNGQELRPPAANATNPPAGDCSPVAAGARCMPAEWAIPHDANDFPAGACADETALRQEDLAGLKLIENRLLRLLDETPADDERGRQGLEETLGNIRRERQALAGVAVGSESE